MPRSPHDNRGRGRGNEPRQQKEERPIERPARPPVFLQGPQPGHSEVIGNVRQAAKPRRRGKHQRQKSQANQQRPSAMGALPIQPRAGCVEQEDRRRQEEA